MVCLLCDFKILLTVFNQSYNCQTSHYTEVRYVSFLSDGFITGIVVNPPERKLAKRTYVHYLGRNWLPKPFLILPSLLTCKREYVTGAIVNLGKFLSQDFTAGKCAKRRAHYPPAAFTKVMRVRSVTFYSSVNFEMSFWCHCLDQNSNKSIVRIFALKVFIAFFGLLESFWGFL